MKKRLSLNEEKDIVRAVVGAKNPKWQSRIEAQLRCMDVREVERILLMHGVDVREKVEPRGGYTARVSDDEIKSMVQDGYSVAQIAEKTNYSDKHVYERLRNMKRKESLRAEGVMA